MVVKIERPHSLFNRLPYFAEQYKIMRLVDFGKRGTYLINPKEVVPMFPFEIPFISEEYKRKKAKEWLSKSKKELEEIGV